MDLAVDLVLLPSSEWVNKLIAINKQLVDFDKQKINLNNSDCLPHLSLAMGVIKDNEMVSVQNILQDLAKDFLPLDISLDGVYENTNDYGEICSCLNVSNGSKLSVLHEKIVEKFDFCMMREVKKEMFYQSHEINLVTINWVQNFLDNASFNNFHPHITLGLGKIDFEWEPLPLKINTLACFQLGNYCTCRKELFKVLVT